MNFPFELKELRAFLAVAKEGSVAQAATVLNISASPLSRQIRNLEAKLNLPLFSRDKNQLRLTAAGVKFTREAEALLLRADDVRHLVQDIQTGADQTIEVGYVPGAMWSGLLPDAMARLSAKQPKLRFRLLPMRSRDQINAIRRNEIELAMVHTPPVDDSGFSASLIENDPFSLVVPAGSPIGGNPSAKELERQTWISLDERISPEFRLQFLIACAAYGFKPDIRHDACDLASLFGLIRCGLGIGIAQSKLRQACPAGVEFRTFFKFPLSVPIYALGGRSAVSEAGKSFIDECCAVAGMHG